MLKLGQIIKLLEGQPKENTVRFDFCGFVPSGVSSYRGYYEDLAIEFEEKYPFPTVAEILTMLKDCIGKTFTGYKGGEYTMDENSQVWVANYSNTSNTVITGIISGEYNYTILQTGYER